MEIIQYAKTGDVQQILAIIKKDKSKIDKRDNTPNKEGIVMGMTPLIIASMHGFQVSFDNFSK
jgi:hypothetical protein